MRLNRNDWRRLTPPFVTGPGATSRSSRSGEVTLTKWSTQRSDVHGPASSTCRDWNRSPPWTWMTKSRTASCFRRSSQRSSRLKWDSSCSLPLRTFGPNRSTTSPARLPDLAFPVGQPHPSRSRTSAFRSATARNGSDDLTKTVRDLRGAFVELTLSVGQPRRKGPSTSRRRSATSLRWSTTSRKQSTTGSKPICPPHREVGQWVGEV